LKYLEESGGLGLIQLLGGAEKSHEKSVRISHVLAEISKKAPPPHMNLD
jgi:hypothetical protein